MKVKTKVLSDGVRQIGYHNGQGWVGLTNIYKERTIWKSDNYSGWYFTIKDWVGFVQKIVDVNHL